MTSTASAAGARGNVRTAAVTLIVFALAVTGLIAVLALAGHPGPRAGSCGAGQVTVGSVAGMPECQFPGQP